LFGTPHQSRRPLLLVLVFGAFLAIVGITASAQSILVSMHFSTSTLNAVVSSDSATARALLNDAVRLRNLDAASPLDAAARAGLDARLAALTRPGEIVRVELRRPDGSIVAASGSVPASGVAPGSDAARTAAAGDATVAIVPALEAGAAAAIGEPTVLREFLPVTVDGEVRAVVAIWRDAAPILQRLESVRRDVVMVTLSAAAIAALLLYLIFRSAQGRLTRQTAALVEATRLDPLTGTLNHGALVGHLAGAIEAARADGSPLGVALVDIDNFRLLDETHGHGAGDQALLDVVERLRRELPDGLLFGRYGPDELLVMSPPALISEVEPALDRLRVALADHSLRFGAGERLPVTVSAGLATYPANGSSLTVLLSAVARTLEEAKASGGDAILVAGEGPAEEPVASAVDVLQGLVRAVDTKDRYTKRHSDDVARYGAFLARRIGLDPGLVESIRLAGLLHDVGKIGTPDGILRKPGKLTAAEYDIVKQHVALGQMIVRDVPDTELIRAGIRYHHERWDGDGYLDGLEGEEIPLIARVLAVGDAFSAMTTTRPYRKALPVAEALARLGDAAGTQLEERLVVAFIEGIESAADAPLPDGEGTPTPHRRPRRIGRVA
jgi:diguanylate cyclase (GGDEF)-like protein